ncbi:MAG: hypothetical protein RL108_82 [Bacteroidota bacterium]
MLNQKNEGLKLIIPSTVDVKSIISRLPKLSKTQSQNLKYRLYYILSRVVVHNENLDFYKSNNYVRTMNSEQMKKVLGNRQYYQALHLLTDKSDPIITTNNKYLGGKMSKSYWLTDKYNTGDILFKTLPKNLNLVSRIKNAQSSYRENMDMTEKYDFLLKQFEEHKITFDPRVYEYINNTYTQLMEKVERNNEFQIKVIQNMIGRWLYYVDKVNNEELNPMVSGKNHRLNSVFTRIHKNLRPFLLCDGKSLVGADVKASQPYILASIMKEEFFSSNNEGYNLKTIYPYMYYELINRNMLTKNIHTELVTSNTGYLNKYVTNNTGLTGSNISYITSTKKHSPYMWCQIFDSNEIRSIQDYQGSPFNEDFYTHVIKANTDYEISAEELKKERNGLKKSTMYVLFDEDLIRRNNNPKVRYMKKCYPGVNKWLESALENIGGKELSYVLQRSESYLLLNHVSRQFNQLYPEAPIFTIHDGLYTSQEYIEPLEDLIKSTGLELTGKLPGVKLECPRMELNPADEDVKKYWRKARWVTNQEKFDKKKRKVFQSNIDRAKIFLK